MKNIAIFASGAGTNAENIINYFKDHPSVKVALIVTNKSTAGVIEVAERHGIPFTVLSEKAYFSSEDFIHNLAELRIGLIVLAGFLWMIPDMLLKAYPNKIVNIHPSLLPKFGGKGMHGMNVHHAVIASAERQAGITIHYVNEEYDAGEVIFQKSIPVEVSDTPQTLAVKVQQLEYKYFPEVIEKLLR